MKKKNIVSRLQVDPGYCDKIVFPSLFYAMILIKKIHANEKV